MKRYIRNSTSDELKQLDSDIDAGDLEIIHDVAPEILKDATAIEYELDESVDAGYDGGYLITYKNGTSKLYGWLDTDSLKGNYKLYEIR